MAEENYSDINLILYHQNKPVGVCRPNYIGLLGMRLKTKDLFFPKDSSLEVEVLGPKKMLMNNIRFPMVVSSSTDKGLGLKFQHYEPELVSLWRLILSRILFKNKN